MIKKAVVGSLETLCNWLDRIPAFERYEKRWHFYPNGGWGCRVGFARWSAQLDARWSTGWWKEVNSA